MKHLAPAVFRDFACAASGCPDSCCRAGWEIVIDPETLERYAALPGPDGDRIRAAVVPGCRGAQRAPAQVETLPPTAADDLSLDHESLLRQDENRICVLLDPDGLCHAQRRFGHESLCRVCREYPRFHREFGNLTEHGISLSCPTAFALAVSAPPRWVEWEDGAPIVPNDLDPARYLLLREGRALALDLLAEESRPLGERLALVWALAQRLQRGLDGRERAGKTACRRLRSPIGQKAALRRIGLRPRRGGDVLAVWVGSRLPGWIDAFSALEILSPEWREGLGTLKERLRPAGAHCKRVQRRQPCGLSRYIAESYARSDMPCLWAASPLRGITQAAGAHCAPLRGCPDSAGEEIYARYLWYSLYKYWLDAADDGRLLARVRRSLAMTGLGLAIDRLVPKDRSWLQRISREIEHCEENLDALLNQSSL